MAYIVDVLIVAAIVTVVTLLLAIPLAAMVGTGPSGTLSAGEVSFVVLIIIAVLVVSLGYFPWFWARSGATPACA